MSAARHVLAALLCMAALGTAGAARAQTTQDANAAAPGDNEIYVENVAPQALTFGLSHDNQSWERFTLEAGKVAVYSGAATWYFLILTEGVPLRYKLIAGKSYRLYWNNVDLRWDMMTCDKPACGRVMSQP